jgi:hypothetical protein
MGGFEFLGMRDHIDELIQRNVFLLVDCADIQDAQDILAFVRSRYKPLARFSIGMVGGGAFGGLSTIPALCSGPIFVCGTT